MRVSPVQAEIGNSVVNPPEKHDPDCVSAKRIYRSLTFGVLDRDGMLFVRNQLMTR
jgi:hypothetical protein